MVGHDKRARLGRHGFGLIGMAIFWNLVIVLIVVLILALARGRVGSGGARVDRKEKTALNLLQERYAAGISNRRSICKRNATAVADSAGLRWTGGCPSTSHGDVRLPDAFRAKRVRLLQRCD